MMNEREYKERMRMTGKKIAGKKKEKKMIKRKKNSEGQKQQ